MRLSFSRSEIQKVCDRTWKTFVGLLKTPMLMSFHTFRSIMTKTSRQHLNICALFLIQQWVTESREKNMLELVSVKCRRPGSCHKIEEKEVLVCHVLLQSPAHRLNTSKCCLHHMSEFSNGQKIKGGVCNLVFKCLLASQLKSSNKHDRRDANRRGKNEQIFKTSPSACSSF